MKKVFYYVLIMLSFFSASAQEKIGVAIMPMSFSGGKNSDEAKVAPSVYEIISGAFVKAKRFNVIERSKLEQLQKEKNLQKTEDYMDGKVVEQGKSLGAQYLILGNVNSAVAKSSTSYVYGVAVNKAKANIQVTIKVVDVATGLVIASENLEGSGDGSGAQEKAMSSLDGEVNKFLSANFPLQFSVVEIQEKGKKGEAKKILISGGSGSGVKVNDEMNVVEKVIVDVDGVTKTRNKVIGRIKVTKVEDADFSQTIVVEGGAAIAEKIGSGVKLKVNTN